MKSFAAHLKRLEQQQLLRQTKTLEARHGVSVQIKGVRLLNFCSNDYLGLADHPKVVEALISGAKMYGVGSGSAHLITGHSFAHQALEEYLAEWTQRPRALLFSTGYMANLGVISGLTDRHDHLYQDKLNHASLIDAAQLSRAKLRRYRHHDVAHLSQLLSQSDQTAWVATDSVFSMDGDVAPLKAIADSCTRHNAYLMVDDAHGFGLQGQQGRGVLSELNCDINQVPIYMATLGKAVGTFGAFVAGSHELIEMLMQQARSYVYTTATPPAVAVASLVALQLVAQADDRREQLNQLVARFRREALAMGFKLLNSFTPIQPIIARNSAQAVQWSEALRQQGLLIQAIRPPTVPKDSPRLRITFSANHTQAQLDQLLDGLSTLDQAE